MVNRSRRVRSYMDPAEYKAALDALGLSSVRTSSEFLRVPMTSNKRRFRGLAAIPWDTTALLRLMVRLKMKPEHIERLTSSKVRPHEK